MSGPGPNNLPAETTSFVGREDELARVGAMFRSGGTLVTLVGPAGAGKTRLARRFAAGAVASSLFESVCFCDLSEARSTSDIVAIVARMLGVSGSGTEIATSVLHALRGRDALLVILDNFEQVTAFADESLGAWRGDLGGARFLVTSRERLALAGERCFEVPPLPVRASVALFTDRARSVRADFEPTGASAADLDALVERLDGMPLAIELAAARIDVLPPRKLLERISARLDLLKKRERKLSARQATLRGALDWSWDLLDEEERERLAACSVFRGGFSLEAAEAVIALEGTRGAIDLVQALVEKSLVRRYEAPGVPGEVRFGLYESIRDYAFEKLVERGRSAFYYARHAAHFAAEGTAWDERLRSTHSSELAHRHRLDCDNFLAAFERTREADPFLSARAGLAAASAMDGSVPAEERARVLDEIVKTAEGARSSDGSAAVLVARSLLDRAFASYTAGQNEGARADLDRSLELARTANDELVSARALILRGMIDVELGRLDEARASVDAGLAIARKIGDRPTEGDALRQLGTLYMKHNQLDEARTNFAAALAVFRSIRHDTFACAVYCGLGIIDQWQGRETEAEADYVQGLELAIGLGEARVEGIIRTNLGLLYSDQDRLADAERELSVALDLQRRAGHRQFVGNTIGCLGALSALRGDLSQARRCYAESNAIFRELGKRRYEAIGLRYIGVLALEEGRVDDARVALEEAVQIASEVGDQQAFTSGALGAALAQSGRIREAAEAFELARASLAARGEPRGVALLELLEGFLDLARAREAKSPAERDTHLEHARSRAKEGASAARKAADARVALRMLLKEIEALACGAGRPPSTPPTPASAGATTGPAVDTRPVVLVGPEARWFEVGGHARVDLSKRRAVRLIVDRLAAAWETTPGRGVDPYVLIAAAWPGERMKPDSASSRLYTSVKTLREAGLADLLDRQDDGYLFSQRWRVQRRG